MEELLQPTRQAPTPKSLERGTSLPKPKVEEQDKTSPATQMRKQQIDSDDDNNEHKSRKARLTQKNLARFNNMVKKKEANKPSALSDSTGESTTKTTSTKTSGFAIQAHKNGMYHPLNSKPLINCEARQERDARFS